MIKYRGWTQVLLSCCATVMACGDDAAAKPDASAPPRDLGATTDLGGRDGSVRCENERDCPPPEPSCGVSLCLGGRCVVAPPDEDFDGHGDARCAVGDSLFLNDDCDDSDSRRFPGNRDRCDDHDDDCDLTTLGDLDADGDGEISSICCNEDSGERLCASDCDDTDPDVNIHAPEGAGNCNGRDDDCDLVVDEECSPPDAGAGDGGMPPADAAMPPGDAAMDGDATTPEDDAGGTDDSGVPPTDAGPGECTSDQPCGGGMVNFPPAICVRGVRPCSAGRLGPCQGSIDPAIEVCDAVDNDCDGMLNEDPDALTSCAAPNAMTACEASVCVVRSCTPGFVDCDGLASTGCEADTQTSAVHCGGCGRACDPGEMCIGGICDPVVDLSAGYYHTCAVRSSGRVDCWGDNFNGQIGDGTTMERRAPVRVIGLDDAVEVTVGYSHTCARRRGGQVACWGMGRLVDGSATDHLTAVAMAGITAAVEVHAASQTCVRLSDGLVMCWGDNEFGQCGSDPATDLLTVPTLVAGVSGATAIAVGGSHTCSAGAAGAVSCWGNNDSLQLGRTMPPDYSGSPLSVSGMFAIGLGLGLLHSCAVPSLGDVYCWGDNRRGEVGAPVGTSTAMPTQVVGLTGVLQIASGGEHTCARRRLDGQTVCWGSNSSGQLGNGTGGTGMLSESPVVVLDLPDAVDVDVGGLHTCALRATGAVVCWGDNTYGQLGTGGPAGSTRPVPVMGLP